VRSGRPLGKTGGSYDPGTITITVLRDTWRRWRQYLCTKSGTTSYGDADFTLQVQMVEDKQDPLTTTATKCHVIEAKNSNKEGPDEALTEVTIQPEYIEEDGLSLFSPEPA